jgi:hypothetical protein
MAPDQSDAMTQFSYGVRVDGDCGVLVNYADTIKSFKVDRLLDGESGYMGYDAVPLILIKLENIYLMSAAAQGDAHSVFNDGICLFELESVSWVCRKAAMCFEKLMREKLH